MARPRNNLPKQTAVEQPEVTPAPVEPLFEIRVNKVVKAFGVQFRPMNPYVVKGKVKDALGDAVASAVPAPQPPG
jgi:hypothetical protein